MSRLSSSFSRLSSSFSRLSSSFSRLSCKTDKSSSCSRLSSSFGRLSSSFGKLIIKAVINVVVLGLNCMIDEWVDWSNSWSLNSNYIWFFFQF